MFDIFYLFLKFYPVIFFFFHFSLAIVFRHFNVVSRHGELCNEPAQSNLFSDGVLCGVWLWALS